MRKQRQREQDEPEAVAESEGNKRGHGSFLRGWRRADWARQGDRRIRGQAK